MKTGRNNIGRPSMRWLRPLLGGAALLLSPMAMATGDCDNDSMVIGGTHGANNFVCGRKNEASGDSSIAVGSYNTASGEYSIAVGRNNTASGEYSNAVGSYNTASGKYSIAVGRNNTASGDQSSAVGYFNTASNKNSSAVGFINTASGRYSSAVGFMNTASGDQSSAMGSFAQVLAGDHAIAIGGGDNAANGARIGTLGGSGAQAAIAIGRSVTVGDGADNSVAIGTNSGVYTNVTGAVALGAGAVATQSDTVSVGSSANQKRIVNVAAGTAGTDAVNKGQMDAAVSAAQAAAISTANTYTDNKVSALQSIADNSAQYTDGGQTLGLNDNGGTGTRIANVAAGTAISDAVNKGQLDSAIAGVTATVGGAAATAQATADTALGNAATAQATADTALGNAAAAQTTADTALGTANNSAQYTDGGQTLGLNANDGSGTRVANVAVGTVDTDAVNKGQLDSAIAGVTATVGGAAATAQATADTALGNAATAQATADTALGNAATAQVTADTALGNAATAQSTATTALAEAAMAQGTADTALGNAAAAQATADTALDMASNSAHYVEGGQTLGLNANDGLGTRVANVAAGTAAMDAVNFSQLQMVMTQLIQSGLCTVSGATVQCGAAAASNAIQTGVGASVAPGADNAVAIGHNASVQSAGGVAIGDGANAVLSNSVAIGAGATALSSVAVGSGAQALGTNTTALGDDALAAGNFGVAVGNNAQALHTNAVALGNGSVTSAAHTVSVGAPGAERRITQVAAPVEASDAATKGYVDGQLGRVATAFEQSSKIARRHAAQGIAATAALMNVAPSAVGRTVIGLATGHYDGSTALGLSVAHAPRADVQLNGGLAATSGGRPVVRLGMALEF